MDRSKPIRRRTAITAAAVIAVVALCALLPAAAAADTSSLTLVASPEVIAYNGASVLTGTLMNTTTATAVGGEAILVESGPAATGPWTTVAVISTLNGTPEYSTGTYTLVVRPRDKTFYRMRFLGMTGLDAAGSAAVSVTPKVYLSRPQVPTSVLHGQRFAVVGYIQPKHPKGLRTVVKFKFYRNVRGKWVLKMARWGKTSNYLNFTKVTRATSIKQPGKWKVKSFAPADALHAASTSAFSKVIRVR